eukprot:Rhum_TRINITY_DN8102_c0_g1::Rhum_TRINITY_DN8102_c0_g1_i1::g.26220::m.26220
MYLVSPSGGHSILAHLGRPNVGVRVRVVHDGLVSAAVGTPEQVVPPLLQLCDGARAHAGLELRRAAVAHDLPRRLRRARVRVARRVTRLLRVHAVVDDVAHDLRVPLRLDVAAHDAEAHPRLELARLLRLLHREPGDDRVERTLLRGVVARGVHARQRRHVEQRTPVLQAEAQLRDHQTRPETLVVALDQRHHHAVAVRNRQVDCVAGVRRRLIVCRAREALPGDGVVRVLARRHVVHRLVHVDHLRTLLRVRLADQPLDHLGCRLAEVRVAVERGPVCEGQLLRLDVEVEVVGRVVSEGAQVEVLEDVQHLDGCDALRVRRQLEDLVLAAVRRRHRLHPLTVVRREVLARQAQARRRRRLLVRGRDAAVVELLAAAVRDLLQRVRQRRVLEDLAGARDAPPARLLVLHREGLQEAVEGVRVLAVRREVAAVRRDVPLCTDHLRHGGSVAGVADGRVEQARPLQLAELLVQVAPPLDRAGNRHAQRPGAWDVRRVERAQLGLQVRVRHLHRRATCAVVAVQLLRARVPHLRHDVAAHPVHHRLYDAFARVGGDRRVHRGPARFQNVDGGHRRQRHARRRDAVLRVHRAAPGEGQARRTRPAARVQRRVPHLLHLCAALRAGGLVGVDAAATRVEGRGAVARPAVLGHPALAVGVLRHARRLGGLDAGGACGRGTGGERAGRSPQEDAHSFSFPSNNNNN